MTATSDRTNAMTLSAISYGGGVQSTALVGLAIQGKIDFEVALFSNVGDDSEHPASLKYVREIMQPYAEAHNFPVHELITMRRGEPTTIRNEIMREGSLRNVIPVYGDIGAPLNRSCTVDFKVKTVGRWLKANGATKADPALVAIGISTDEIERAGRGKDESAQKRVYPLLDLGLNRYDCTKVISGAGLPVPPKSSCFFCPFHKPLSWSEMRRDEPELFEQSVVIEKHMNDRNAARNRNPVYLTRFGKPLNEAVGVAQDTLFQELGIGENGCDSGFCWT
jgi:hypothetical protein